MKSSKHSSGINVEFLALALMFCLLVSVVALLVLGQAEAKRRAAQEFWGGLAEETGSITAQVEKDESELEDLVFRINHARLDRENRVIQTAISELEEKMDLLAKIEEAKKESERVAAAIKKDKDLAAYNPSDEARRMLGQYRGRFVLLECRENHAVVYPGGERLPMKPSDAEFKAVVKQIENAGFVAFVVRPEGWHGNSFDQLKSKIYAKLDELEEKEEQAVGRCIFPLESDKSIDAFLPPGSKKA